MRVIVSFIVVINVFFGFLSQSQSKVDRKNEAIKLMRTSHEDVQQASKRLGELIQDQDFGVSCQAAFTTVRLGQKFAEKIRSPELEKALVQMVSREVEAKKDGIEMDVEITEDRGIIWTVKRSDPSIIMDTKIEEGKRRKSILFLGPCLYSGIQALGEIRAASNEVFDLLKKLIQSEDKNIRLVAAYAMATLDCPINEKLKVLRDRQKEEADEQVKDFIQGSICVVEQVYSVPSLGYSFVVEEQPGQGGYTLRVKGTSQSASGPGPTLQISSSFPVGQIIKDLAAEHRDLGLQNGELWVAFNPGSEALYFAYKAKGKIFWYGYELNSGDDGFIMLTCWVDKNGKMSKWYLNAGGAGADLGGIKMVDATGWLERRFRKESRYDGTDPKPISETPWAEKIILHPNANNSGRGEFEVVLWEATRVPSGNLQASPDCQCRIRGYWAPAEPSESPSTPKEGRIIAMSIEEVARPEQSKIDANKNVYTVNPGDTLFYISEKVYGDMSKWKAILDANPELQGKPFNIRVGMKLKIPGRGLNFNDKLDNLELAKIEQTEVTEDEVSKHRVLYQEGVDVTIVKEGKSETQRLAVYGVGGLRFPVGTMEVDRRAKLSKTIIDIENANGNYLIPSKESAVPLHMSVDENGKTQISFFTHALNVIWRFTNSGIKFDSGDSRYEVQKSGAYISFTEDGVKVDGVNDLTPKNCTGIS
jgi:hypothetical protein